MSKKEKYCSICNDKYFRRGKTCSSKCAGILRKITLKFNDTEKIRKQKISNTMKNKDWTKIIEKRKIKMKEKFGDLGYSHPIIQKKQRETKIKNDTLPNSESVLKKQFETKSKNGTLPNSKNVIEKQLKTFFSKGEEFIKDIVKKRNETYKKNNTHTKSKPSDLFYIVFKDSLELEREYQIFNKKSWFIDFYSKKFDIYIQFDGSYWHGLYKSEEEIQKEVEISGKNRRVLNHIFNDRKQNEYFNVNNLKLYRISDIDFLNFLKRAQPHNKNPLNSGKLQFKLDNPELAFKILYKISYFKSSATTIERQLNESNKSNLIVTSRVDFKENRNRGILINIEDDQNKI